MNDLCNRIFHLWSGRELWNQHLKCWVNSAWPKDKSSGKVFFTRLAADKHMKAAASGDIGEVDREVNVELEEENSLITVASRQLS